MQAGIAAQLRVEVEDLEIARAVAELVGGDRPQRLAGLDRVGGRHDRRGRRRCRRRFGRHVKLALLLDRRRRFDRRRLRRHGLRLGGGLAFERRQAFGELLLDARQHVLVGLHVARMRPLERRLEPAAGAPVGVAQMVVEHRIVRLQRHRALELAHRVVELAEPVIGPAQRIDDVAVARPEIDRLADQVHGLVEVHVHVDPGIAEIVHDLRLVRDRVPAPCGNSARPSAIPSAAHRRCRADRRCSSRRRPSIFSRPTALS